MQHSIPFDVHIRKHLCKWLSKPDIISFFIDSFKHTSQAATATAATAATATATSTESKTSAAADDHAASLLEQICYEKELPYSNVTFNAYTAWKLSNATSLQNLNRYKKMMRFVSEQLANKSHSSESSSSESESDAASVSEYETRHYTTTTIDTSTPTTDKPATAMPATDKPATDKLAAFIELEKERMRRLRSLFTTHNIPYDEYTYIKYKAWQKMAPPGIIKGTDRLQKMLAFMDTQR